jgi:hypothetical protein
MSESWGGEGDRAREGREEEEMEKEKDEEDEEVVAFVGEEGKKEKSTGEYLSTCWPLLSRRKSNKERKGRISVRAPAPKRKRIVVPLVGADNRRFPRGSSDFQLALLLFLFHLFLFTSSSFFTFYRSDIFTLSLCTYQNSGGFSELGLSQQRNCSLLSSVLFSSLVVPISLTFHRLYRASLVDTSFSSLHISISHLRAFSLALSHSHFFNDSQFSAPARCFADVLLHQFIAQGSLTLYSLFKLSSLFYP